MQEVVGSIPISSTSNLALGLDLDVPDEVAGKGHCHGYQKWTRTFPAYPRRPHSTGLARVIVHGKTLYLGKHNSPESWRRYQQIRTAYDAGVTDPGMTLGDVCKRFFDEYVDVRFAHNKDERDVFRAAIDRTVKLFGPWPAAGFSPACYDTLRKAMQKQGLASTTIAHYLRRVRVMLRWAAQLHLVAPQVIYLIESAPSLPSADVRKPEQVKGVSDADFQATLQFISPKVRDMLLIQRMTGMRPGEIRLMRASEVDTSTDIWVYSPSRHKTAHRGKTRIVGLNREAMRILEQHLKQARPGGHVFVSSAGLPFTTDRLCQIVKAACKRAGVPQWSPNQLRHAFAAEVDAKLGRLSTSKLMGHAKPDTTALYVDRDLKEIVRLTQELEKKASEDCEIPARQF